MNTAQLTDRAQAVIAASDEYTAPIFRAPSVGCAGETAFSADKLTRDQKSVLLYAETVIVDRGGLLTGARMNADDIANLKTFQDAGLLRFGRIPFALIKKASDSADSYPSTHWIEFTEKAWSLVGELRRTRSAKRGPYAEKVFAAIAATAATGEAS